MIFLIIEQHYCLFKLRKMFLYMFLSRKNVLGEKNKRQKKVLKLI